MGIHTLSHHTYLAMSDEPVSGSKEIDQRVSHFLQSFKESNWIETFGERINLDTLNMNVHLAQLLMLASIPKQILSTEQVNLIQENIKTKSSRFKAFLCPGFFLFSTSILVSASIGLCYFFTKDQIPLNAVNLTIILSVTALVSLVASQIFMHCISVKRAQKLAKLTIQELNMWDHFEQNTIKPVAREWLKLFDAKALNGESHHKFQTRRKLAVAIYEKIDLDHVVSVFKEMTTHTDKIDHLFTHLMDTRHILERQIAFEGLNLEFITPDRLYYNLSGSDMGLYASTLNYFKKVSNRWEI